MPDRDLKHRKPYAYKKTRKVEGFSKSLRRPHWRVEPSEFLPRGGPSERKLNSRFVLREAEQTNKCERTNKSSSQRAIYFLMLRVI
jgi:hypothetical protein